MKPIPDYNATTILATWLDDLGECLYELKISYKTDSVYLYEYHPEEDIPSPVLEFISDNHIYDVRDQKKPKLIGRIRTPHSREYSDALEFVSCTSSVNGQPAMRVLYGKPHGQMFINFEKVLCKLLTVHHDSPNRLIDDFLNANWDALKAANLSHPELIIDFN